MSDIILFSHPTFGVLGILAAVWLLVEALNASNANQARIRYAAFAGNEMGLISTAGLLLVGLFTPSRVTPFPLLFIPSLPLVVRLICSPAAIA